MPEIPVLYADDDEDSEPQDDVDFMSDSEIDEVNKRIPELVAVEDPAEDTPEPEEPAEEPLETADVEDKSASASGG